MSTQEKISNIYEERIQTLREKGQKEYAHNNAFDNFERVGRELELDRKKVLMVYALKHRDGIQAWMDGHTSQREPVTGRMEDFAVYMFLLYGMLDETSSNRERTSRKDMGRVMDDVFYQYIQPCQLSPESLERRWKILQSNLNNLEAILSRSRVRLSQFRTISVIQDIFVVRALTD